MSSPPVSILSQTSPVETTPIYLYKIHLNVIHQRPGLPSGRFPIVVPVCKGGNRSLVSNYRPISLTPMVSKQMEHVIASYQKEIWNKKDWIFEGQHGFRPRFSSEIQVITICQGTADSLITEVRQMLL
jgi:hypothetical protein